MFRVVMDLKWQPILSIKNCYSCLENIAIDSKTTDYEDRIWTSREGNETKIRSRLKGPNLVGLRGQALHLIRSPGVSSDARKSTHKSLGPNF